MEWHKEQYSIDTDKSKLDVGHDPPLPIHHRPLGDWSTDEHRAQIDRELACALGYMMAMSRSALPAS